MRQSIIHETFNRDFEMTYKNEKALYQMPPHTHNAIEIYLNLSHIPHSIIGSHALPLGRNTLLIIPPYCVHQLSPAEDIAYKRYVLTINSSWLDTVLGNPGSECCRYLKDSNAPLIIPVTDEQLEQLSASFRQLQSLTEREPLPRISYFFTVMTLIDQIAMPHTLERFDYINNQLSGTARTVSEMIDYIHAHLYEKIRIQDIAGRFYLNPDYASRLFKRYANTTIGNYITIQRMARARQLLREGDSISQVQQKTGYESYEHFFRTFKKSVGCTPREYQAGIQRYSD